MTLSPSFRNYSSKQCSFPRLPQHQGLGGGGAPGTVITHQYSYVCLHVTQLAGSAQEGSLSSPTDYTAQLAHTQLYVLQRAEVQSQHVTSLQVSFLPTGCPPMQHRAEHPGAGLGEQQHLLSLAEKTTVDSMD